VSVAGPMLELDRVETYRGPAQILRSVSLTLAGGEAVCLVGRNGAGKTTTIDTIMGLLPPRSGSVRFKGQDVTRLAAHERARLGIGDGLVRLSVGVEDLEDLRGDLRQALEKI